jgi:hypothetical protein
MNINTLEFVHELLRAEATRADEVYKASRRLQHEYEDRDDPNPELCKHQKKAADEHMAISFRARNALEDFEAQEW